jgi:hypothetical protein
LARSGVSRAQENRAIRQEALREQLAKKGLVQEVLKKASILADLDTQLEPNETTRLKYAIDAELRLVAKYLGDVKAVELTGEAGGPLRIEMVWQDDDED